MNRWVGLCLDAYRRLASAYPHEFRMLYGEDLDRSGEDAVPVVWRHYGIRGLAGLLFDIAIRLPAEYLSEMRQDVLYALRLHAKSPGFAAVSILSLAIGIGMCSVLLSESKSLIGPAPGLPDADGLMTFEHPLSYPDFERFRNQRQVSAMAAVLGNPVPFAVRRTDARDSRAQRFYGRLVSPKFFATMGLKPQAGRFFRQDSEKPGMAPVVVVSDRFWRTRLNADPNAVGSTLRLNGRTATIVGIAPRGFSGLWPWNPLDLYVPVTCGSLAPELPEGALNRRDFENFRVVLRLRPGITVPAAEAAFTALARTLDRETLGLAEERKNRRLRVIPAGTIRLVTPQERSFVITFNVILWALVLSLACANLANLLLARGAQRRREVAVRLSVGASRWRLVRQFLTESVLLALAGGVASLVPAYWITHTMASLEIPADFPVMLDVEPDFRVIAFTLGIAALAGVGFGLAPALASTRVGIGAALKEGAQAPLRGYRRLGLRNLFVAYQVASSLMVLLVAAVLVEGYRVTSRVDLGINSTGLGLLSLDPVRDGYSPERLAELFRKLPGRLARVAGVHAAALAGPQPLVNTEGTWPNTRIAAPTGPRRTAEVQCSAFRTRIGAGYFAALDVPLVRGRDFEERDQWSEATPKTAVPAVINQAAARALFGSADPIGRGIREDELNYTVIGVARDVRTNFLMPLAVPTVFLPFTAESFVEAGSQGANLLIRGSSGRDTLQAVRNEIEAVHPDLTVFKVRTARDEMEQVNAFFNWSSSLYVALGLFALLLAGVGLGGVTAYAVAQRRKEIGIRMALGARGAQVRRLVLREGVALVATGSLAGFAGAFAIERAISALASFMPPSFFAGARDPFLFAGAPLLLAALALAACYLPARRATEIDPVRALHEE